MSRMCLASGEDYARHAGITLRKASCDDEALSGLPLFRSMEAALQFAFNWRATSGMKIGEIKEYTGKVGGMILSASEKKAQAGLILDVISSHLSRDQQALLDASYGGENGERHAGIERLTHLCAHQNRTLVRLLMMREFIHGERYCPSQEDIARECAVHQATVSRVASKIAKTIAELRESTIDKLTPAFQRRNWVPRNGEKN